MKKLFLLLLTVSFCLYGYQLNDGFLKPDNYVLQYGDNLLPEVSWISCNVNQGLKTTDIERAINELFTELTVVTGKPAVAFSSAVNSTAACKIVWEYIASNAIMNCETYTTGAYTGFLIRVNSKIQSEPKWYNNVNGFNMHMNLRSVLKHELGHALGLADQGVDHAGLMYESNNVAGVPTTIDLSPKADDINGLKHIYEEPTITLLNKPANQTEFVLGDTLKFEIKMPELQPVSGTTPSLALDLFLAKYMGDFIMPLDINFSGASEQSDKPLSVENLNNGTYRVEIILTKSSEPDDQFTIKAFNKRNDFTCFSNYEEFGTSKHYPCGEFKFKVTETAEFVNIKDGDKLLATPTQKIEVKFGKTTPPKGAIYKLYADDLELTTLSFDSNGKATYNWNTSNIEAREYSLKIMAVNDLPTKENITLDVANVKLYTPTIISPTPDDWNAQCDTIYFVPGAVCQDETLTLDKFNIENLAANYTINSSVATGNGSGNKLIWGWKDWIWGQTPPPAPGYYTVNLNLHDEQTTYTSTSSDFFVSKLAITSLKQNVGEVDTIFAIPGKKDTLEVTVSYRSDGKYPEITFRNGSKGNYYLTSYLKKEELPAHKVTKLYYEWDLSNIQKGWGGKQRITPIFPAKQKEQKYSQHGDDLHFYYPYFFDDFSSDRGWDVFYSTFGGINPVKFDEGYSYLRHANPFTKAWRIKNGVYFTQIEGRGNETPSNTNGDVYHLNETMYLVSPSIPTLHYLDDKNKAYAYYRYKIKDDTWLIDNEAYLYDDYPYDYYKCQKSKRCENSSDNEWHESLTEITPELGNTSEGFFYFIYKTNVNYNMDSVFSTNYYLDDICILIDKNSVPVQYAYYKTRLESRVSNKVSLDWYSGKPDEIFYKENTPLRYIIYRNNDSLASVTETHYTDLSAVPNKEYMYSISIVYPDNIHSNPKACKIFVSLPDPAKPCLKEDFEVDSLHGRVTQLPFGWNCNLFGSSTAYWQVSNSADSTAQNGRKRVELKVTNSYEGDESRLFTRPFNLSELYKPSLQFDFLHSTANSDENDYVQVQIYTEAAGWQSIGTPYYRCNGSDGWADYQLDLNTFAGQSYVLIGFMGHNAGGQNICLDNIEIKTEENPFITYTGTHQINADLVIPANKTLILAPGTTLLFAPNTSLVVEGLISANGSDNNIVLAAQDAGQPWQGVRGTGINSIDLTNVSINDAVIGVDQFGEVRLNSCEINSCERAINLTEANYIEIKNSSITDCIIGIKISNSNAKSKNQIIVTNNTIVSTDNVYKIGLYVYNTTTSQSIIKENKISRYGTGISLYYGNSLCEGNQIDGCDQALRIFESSPILKGNQITENNYGIYTVGYSAPVLNPFWSAEGFGGHNNIHDNRANQIYYDQNASIILDRGNNDIYSSSATTPLIYKYNNQVKTIWARENYWGNKFDPQNPSIYFEPWSNFYFEPYSQTPNVVNNMNFDQQPVDNQLKKFDLALKKEINKDNAAASVIYSSLITEETDKATEILPRIEYNQTNNKSKSVLDMLHSNNLITDFIYYSALARNAKSDGNMQLSADYYLLKLDNSQIYSDTLIAKINLLDTYWGNNKNLKFKNQLKSLTCKSEDDYNDKREKLLLELFTGKTAITAENTVKAFGLMQNYPNPFNPTTSIKYAIPENGNVKIKIYNQNGALVSELNEGACKTGYHTANFNGRKLASGVYIYQLEFNGNAMMKKKMIMVK